MLAGCQTLNGSAGGPASVPAPLVSAAPMPVPAAPPLPPRRVTLSSTDPADFADMATATAPPRQVAAELYLPAARGQGRLPAVVILHGRDGIGARERMYAAALAEAGIAALLPASFGARHGDAASVSYAAQLADADAARRLLASDPRFDGAHIGILGFGRGGSVTLLAAHTPFLRLEGGQAPFAALMPFYPSCTWHPAHWHTSGAAILMVTAASDDWTPPDDCGSVIDALTHAGSPVATKRYARTYRDFDQVPIAVRTHPELRRIEGCDSVIDDQGHTTLTVAGTGPGTGLGGTGLGGTGLGGTGLGGTRLGHDFAGYLRLVDTRCGKAGVHTGADVDLRANTVADVVTFFSESLKSSGS